MTFVVVNPQHGVLFISGQKQPTESAPESAGAAAAAPAAAPAEPELALPPDLREMTVLRRGSNAEEVGGEGAASTAILAGDDRVMTSSKLCNCIRVKLAF